MQFDTEVALAIRQDLAAWQMINVAAFLAGGVAAAHPECVGDRTRTAPERPTCV